MESSYHLTRKQVLTRIISMLVCAVGVSACAYSLTMQVREIGTMMSSITWFSGLFAVVFAIAGYAVTCDIGREKNYVRPAVLGIVLLSICCIVFSQLLLYTTQVIVVALIAAAIQLVVLVAYHFALKREDPDAL